MRYITNGYELKASKFGGDFYYLFFKRDDGRAFRTCLAPSMRNFSRWDPVMRAVKAGKEVILENLREKNSAMIDADSIFKMQITQKKEQPKESNCDNPEYVNGKPARCGDCDSCQKDLFE